MLRQCLTNTAHAARGEQEKKHRENEKQADAPNLSAAFALAACDFPAAEGGAAGLSVGVFGGIEVS